MEFDLYFSIQLENSYFNKSYIAHHDEATIEGELEQADSGAAEASDAQDKYISGPAEKRTGTTKEQAGATEETGVARKAFMETMLQTPLNLNPTI